MCEIHLKNLIDDLEKVQKYTIKLLRQCRHKCCMKIGFNSLICQN